MARHAPDNSATDAVNRIAVFKVSTAWDVAGDAGEHAATMVRRLSVCAWQSESGCHRIGRSQSKKKPLAEELREPGAPLRLIQRDVHVVAPIEKYGGTWPQGTYVPRGLGKNGG